MIRRYLVTARIPFVVALAFGGMCAGRAAAHGIPMNVNADGSGQLFATSLVSYDAVESQLTPFPAGTPTLLRGAAGFYPVFGGGIPTGTVLTVDMAGSLLHPQALAYWDGTSVLPSPVTINLTRTAVNALVSPTDTFVAGGPLGAYSGALGGHSSLTLGLPLSAPVGLYAIGFQVSGPGFTHSQTFWGVANYGVPEQEVPAGLAAIASAVPEPSSVALGIAGAPFLALVLLARRRAAKRQTNIA